MSIGKSTTRLLLSIFSNSSTQKSTHSVWKIRARSKYHSSSCNIINNKVNINANLWHKNAVRFIRTNTCSNAIVSFNLSDIGEGIREVIVKEWYVKEGDTVSQFDNICEVQSDKASVTITSRYDGVIKKLHHAIDDIALVGKPLVDIETEQSEDENKEKENVATITEKTESAIKVETEEISGKSSIFIEGTKNHGFAIPSVRRLAKENKIELTSIKGTGKDGRVLKEDVLNYLKQLSSPAEALQKKTETKTVPVRGYTRTMIKTMSEAMKIPHFVYHDEIRVTNLIKLRDLIKQRNDDIKVKITFMPFFIKATSNALSRYPIINARLDETGENIIYNESHNIAVAMDTSIGLAVPVIKNVQNKNILEISKELNRLQDLGKQTKFSQDDLSGGTFTFSNVGAIGGTYAKPIIMPPQSAIIALGAFQKLPRFDDNGSVVSEHIAYLSGAADHRIIDGATMARFCNIIKQQIAEPYFLFLDV